MTGLVSVDPNTIIVIACVIGAIQIGVHVIKRAVDLWIDTAAQRHDPIDRLADSLHDDAVPPYVGFDKTPEVAPENEPSWPGKASLELVPREQMVVLGGNPARFDLTAFTPTGGAISDTPPETDTATPEETSGRHARVDGDDTTTGLMRAIEDEPVAEEVGAS